MTIVKCDAISNLIFLLGKDGDRELAGDTLAQLATYGAHCFNLCMQLLIMPERQSETEDRAGESNSDAP